MAIAGHLSRAMLERCSISGWKLNAEPWTFLTTKPEKTIAKEMTKVKRKSAEKAKTIARK
jgi:hypothetical protein